MSKNIIKTVKIKKIVEECTNIKSYIFNLEVNEPQHENNNTLIPLPGQFAMIWVPGIDEIPMSISDYNENGDWTITVKAVGECTNALQEMKVGDYIGVRGPLGNSFQLPGEDSKDIYLIGGGIGMAPLKFLASSLQKNYEFTVVYGAKSSNNFGYGKDFQTYKNNGLQVVYCTDDGSYGSKGFAPDTFKQLIEINNSEHLSNSIAYACGPEKMLYKLFKICESYNIQLQVSLERMMRCGCGLCGLCALDPIGLLVCKDGPIFNSEQLRKISDFGKYTRDFSGRKRNL
ncbi:MAG: dihydroorotate dehydrogenase electron transfer subunit [Candidatus Lokiarchaeota archaeon]|nr:dihydroorotate dehydrogenase electron transfer subunit [Candidatus Lokiarchaeota archaeon]MBD3339404.1 dihydroorotate dehydrogenase electron transfer subunit [Candidatus Lokiarchaeota archaeon]